MSYSFPLRMMAVAIASATCLPVSAAGFQLNETSISGLGRAYAGEAAASDNVAVLARNSAVLTSFDKATVSTGVAYVHPQVDISGTVTSDLGGLYNNLATMADGATGSSLPRVATSYSGDQQNIAGDAAVPNLYLAIPLNNQWVFGFGSFAEFGLSTDYPASSNTLEYGDKTELTTVTLKPSLGWKVNDQLSLGAGIRFLYADATLSTSTPAYFNGLAGAVSAYNPVASATGVLPQLPVVPANQPILHVSGDDWGYGYDLGLVYAPIDSLRLAASYRSEVDLTLSGTAHSALLAVANGSGSVDLTLPATTEFAARWQAMPAFTFYASAQLTGWNSFDRLVVDLDASGTSLVAKEEHWQDAWRYAIGADWAATPTLTLKAGYANDQSPVPAEYRTLSIPDADRQWASLGLSWVVTRQWQIDAGYSYLMGENVDIHESFSMPVNGSMVAVSHFDGELASGDAHLFGLGVSYHF